jgi:hypothetical protein
MRNVADKSRTQMKTHMMFPYFFPENPAAYEIIWKNTADPDRPQVTI